MYFWYYLQFFILTLKSSLAKVVNTYFFYQKFEHMGKNTSKYCSRIIVVHVHATVSSKVHPACHNTASTVSNQEVTLKRLISMLRIAQKLCVGA